MMHLYAVLVVLLACSVMTSDGHSSKKQSLDEELVGVERVLEDAFEQVIEERELDEVLVQNSEDKKPSQASRNIQHMHQFQRSASETMRAFNRASKRTRELMERMERRNERLDAFFSKLSGKNEDLERGFRSLGLQKRADEDTFCSISINCSVTSNRNMLSSSSSTEFRTIDGTCNNLGNFAFGRAGVQHKRVVDQAYNNDRWNPRANSVTGTRRDPVPLPHVRNVTLAVHRYDQTTTPTNTENITTLLFQWGQFLDHDIIKTPEGNVSSTFNCCDTSHTTLRAFCMPIHIASGDPHFTNGICMDARRSFTVLLCNDSSGFQNQINDITAYIDASNVYGSSDHEMNTLRSFNGGYLKTTTADFLPEAADSEHLPCDEPTAPGICFETGDTRANVIAGLTGLHTIFVRMHNLIAKELGDLQSSWDDERLFQETRKIVAAMMQKITYDEFLPAVLDGQVMADHSLNTSYTYNSTLDASIIQGFAIAYRIGHSWIPGQIGFTRLEGSTNEDIDSVNTENAFKKPSLLFKRNYKGIDEIGLWLANSGCPAADRYMERAALDKLFLDSDGFSFDLASLNNMRAREWGTPSFTKFREYCGLGTASSWSDLSDSFSSATLTALQSVYDDPNDIDPFTGFVSETPTGSSLAGPVTSCILGEQFHNLKHGDRFWYQTTDSNLGFTSAQLVQIEKVTLARVLCDTLNLSQMRPRAFHSDSDWALCSSTSDIPTMSLSAWG